MMFVANIWPIMDSLEKRRIISTMIEEYGTVERIIETNFTRKGLRNYLLQIYTGQKWTGSLRNHYRQVWKCVNARFKEDSSMQSYVFSCDSLEQVLEFKDRARRICGIGKHAMHICDDECEANVMLELLESPNNLELMNGYMPDHYRCFTRNLDRIKKYCEMAGIDIGELVIVSDAVKSLYEVKPCRKISWISLSKGMEHFPDCLERLNSREYDKCINRWIKEIRNPDNQVRFCGFRFITLQLLQKIEMMDNAEKECAK